MERKKASDFDPEVLDLFDRYVHGGIDRREFLDRASRYAMGGVTAVALLESLSPNYALAQQVAPDDQRLALQYVVYDSPEGYGEVRALLARPVKATGKLPGVVVVHENRGLNPYIEDVARRTALAGYLVLAPDGLTSLGDFVAAVKYLEARPDCTGRVGCVGFCYGGGVCNALAVRIPDLAAAVPFYGRQPDAADVPKIQAPLLLHYAENDERVNAGWPAYEKALKANGVDYTVYIYPGTRHGFHNDTTPRYDEEAAKRAWERTLAFFAEHLR
jgi:carboxymethylenebutenolidase